MELRGAGLGEVGVNDERPEARRRLLLGLRLATPQVIRPWGSADAMPLGGEPGLPMPAGGASDPVARA